MSEEMLSHRKEVIELAQIVNNKQTYNKDMFAVDVGRWGIDAPFTDCENMIMYRDTLSELAADTFCSDEEKNESPSNPHYHNAPYESIFDY